jgi:hypothetical protein
MTKHSGHQKIGNMHIELLNQPRVKTFKMQNLFNRTVTTVNNTTFP